MGNLSSKQDYKNAGIGFTVMLVVGLILSAIGVMTGTIPALIFGILVTIVGAICAGIYWKKYSDAPEDGSDGGSSSGGGSAAGPVDCSVKWSDFGTCQQQPDGTWKQFSQGTITHGTNGGKDDCDTTPKSQPCVPPVPVDCQVIRTDWSSDCTLDAKGNIVQTSSGGVVVPGSNGGKNDCVANSPATRPCYETDPAPQSTFLGCYSDNAVRAVPTQLLSTGSVTIPSETCIKLSKAAGYDIAALQWHNTVCFAGKSTDPNTKYDRYGVSGNCVKNGGDGGWANEVYKIL
jgi:hypothetical protein